MADARRAPMQMVQISAAERQTVQAALVAMPPAERHAVRAVYIEPHISGRVLRLAGIALADCAMLHRRALVTLTAKIGRAAAPSGTRCTYGALTLPGPGVPDLR